MYIYTYTCSVCQERATGIGPSLITTKVWGKRCGVPRRGPKVGGGKPHPGAQTTLALPARLRIGSQAQNPLLLRILRASNALLRMLLRICLSVSPHADVGRIDLDKRR